MLLQLTNICKSYPQAENGQHLVLNGINLEIDSGESLSIVGPSGIGKSTLLNIIGGLDAANSGEVILCGKLLTKLSDNELADIRNTEIGFVFQLHYLLPQLNVLENVLLPTLAMPTKANKNALIERAGYLLNKTGLETHKYKYPAQLSVGECQRVAVIRSLINKPKLLIADEPTGSLDEHTAAALSESLIQIQHDEKVALIVATHDLALAAKMNRKLQIKNGKLHD